MYDYKYPIERRVIEDRLFFLEREYYRFDYMINPYHIQPGLILDLDITSIKRKKVTLDGMANVLNEFLHGVSKGFQDAAFATFSRRRSTVREDINQSFSAVTEEHTPHAPAASNAYLDMLNTGRGEAAPALEAPKKGRQAKKANAGLVKRGGRRGRPKK